MTSAARFLALSLLAVSAGCALKHDPPTWLEAKAKSDAAAAFYKEETYDDRLHVFGVEANYKTFLLTREMPLRVTLIGGGPKGETVYIEADGKDPGLQARLRREYDKRHPAAKG